MTCEIFQDFLVSLDRIMASKSRKILLFVDQCPVHPKDVRNCKNVQVEFFPANTTSVLQPMDERVISTLKQKFGSSFVLRLLQGLHSSEDSYKMSFLDAVFVLAIASNSVGKDTIANCFREAGFITNTEPAKQDGDGGNKVSCDAWPNLWEKLNIRSTFEEFVRAYDALPLHVEVDVDKLHDDVVSNPDELEWMVQWLVTVHLFPHVLMPWSTCKSMNIFCEATQMFQST
jgi:hypothetical protein